MESLNKRQDFNAEKIGGLKENIAEFEARSSATGDLINILRKREQKKDFSVAERTQLDTLIQQYREIERKKAEAEKMLKEFQK